ncbi:AAA family ATPase [Noviherbaspirillum sp.]|uniref:AAA family ATPase n=1 Tax=Noviherbaspirillum sp. TaxID=1926288 RepID=UPI002B49C9DA|nr:AAA family ATPase [Noviherbaspirillum sp.]HJV82345.1 AAA family ATPase [Noviherbaspirillum sp.]
MSQFEKKLSGLILKNFEEISAVGTAKGQRGKLVAKLIQNAGDGAAEDFDLGEEGTGHVAGTVSRLSQITVGNFRGFSDNHSFSLIKKFTFAYGPNGTGKSSLCEAFEYCLLGSIHEADNKRIDVASYIRNSITGLSDRPVLKGIGADGKEVDVEADPTAYEFCFIEKNRIDGFARVAANTTSAQQTRLASLFGLDEFNGFATQFNDNFENYLDCVGQKIKLLKDKEKQTAGHKQILELLPAKEKEVIERTEVLLKKYDQIKTLVDLKVHISGAGETEGILAKTNSDIAKRATLRTVADPGVDLIVLGGQKLSELLKERTTAKQFLAGYKDQLSLRDLYVAIIANKVRYADNCPACESPIHIGGALAVPVDPYANAENKVKQFDEAMKKEARIAKIKEELDAGWVSLNGRIERLPDLAKAVSFPDEQKIGALYEAAGKVTDAKSLEEFVIFLTSQAALLRALKETVVAFNSSIEQSKAEIKALQSRALLLTKDLEEIAAISASAKSVADSKDTATKAIAKFNEENAALIKEAEAEKPIVERNMKYLSAYGRFREKLLAYNACLPLALAANLNEKTMEFYNAINKHDHYSDWLVGLSLPTATGKKIEIEFEKGKKLDALQVLSEGHIRCLGLAILLAKIVRDDLPFLIFDDVVNSIDDEHRTGIIEIVLGNEEISRRQLIITTHGEDFVKRLENFVSKKDHPNLVNRIDFLVPTEPKKILVKLDSPRSYLVVAQRQFDEGRIRDSIGQVRRSFEEILNRLWKKIAAKGHNVQLKLGLRAPGAGPDLMALANGLHEYLSKKEVQVFQEVLPLLGQMLGREKTHAEEWNYLNKGTHEEDRETEFDAVLVKEMLALVEQMEEVIAKGGATQAKAMSTLAA